jgi:tetratricopeptide (TPR) repeat protein
VIAFPPEREAEVMTILGTQADETQNYQAAAQLASQETAELSGRDLYFAWFNLGSNLAAQEDYAGAAQAFDRAFGVYPAIPESERPWRVMWYRVEPYAAYFHTGRYQDVINLANNTFFALGEYTLEESFYWRGLANQELGNTNEAIFDLRKVLELNPNFTPAREALSGLGIEAP